MEKPGASGSLLDGNQHIAFFEQAFGAEVLFSLTDKTRAPLSAEQLGPKNGLRPGKAIVAVSMLRLRNGPNVEIFEIDQPDRPGGGNIADIGISHFSVTVDDIDAAGTAFVAAGGTLLEGPYDLGDQEQGQGNRGRFGLTPWGLLIEFEQLPSPMKYDGSPSTVRWLPARD